MVTSKRTPAYFPVSLTNFAPSAAASLAALGMMAISGPSLAQSAGTPYGPGATVHRIQSAQSSGGGFFSALFGGGSSRSSHSRRNRYDTRGSGGAPYGGYSWRNSYPSYSRSYGRYRTLCVRTCDGYYFPISFSTTRAGFARDAQKCESSCSAPAKLFVYRNPGADIEHMVSLDGERYASMENAFRYREEYVENCRCKPDPWTEAAREMYERRAEANPDPIKTAENQTAKQTMTDAGSAASRPPARSYTRPKPRRRRRIQKVDPAYEGRWWAGSW